MDQNVSLKGRLKPSDSACQLLTSYCFPGSPMSLLIVLYPFTSCLNFTSPASQAFLCVLSDDKSEAWKG